MFASTFKRRFKASRPSHPQSRRRRSVPLAVEWLEERAVPSSVKFGYAFGLGSQGYDEGEAISTDRFGNVYVAGYFQGRVDFDPGPGIFNLDSYPSNNFVAKYSNDGALLWAKALAKTPSLYGADVIATDTNCNVYVAMRISDYPRSFSLFKLDSNGNLLWTDQLGTLGGIAVDAGGNVYTTGAFMGTTDFDPGPGTYNLTSFNQDIFVSKLDTNGNFVWAKHMGGSGSYAGGQGIAVDGSGNIYTTGSFQGTVDFDPGAGTFYLTAFSTGNPAGNAFVSKLDSNGNFIWAKELGNGEVPADTSSGKEIAVDGSGNVITTGTFQGTGDFDPGPGTFFLTDPIPSSVTFMSKLDNNGNFVWAKLIGAPQAEWGLYYPGAFCGGDPVVDQAGNIYTAGLFEGTCDFDPGPGTFNLTSTISRPYFHNAFVSKLDSNGNFVWAESLGAGTDAVGSDIALDSAGNVFTTGYFQGTADFDPGPGPYLLTASYYDIFVSKLTVVDRLIVTSLPSATTAGNAFTFDVTAKDSDGNTVTGYLGTVHFASSDARAILPTDYTFTAQDAGQHAFSAILKTAGSQSLTATDTVTSSITASASVTVNPAAASTLVLIGYPSSTTAGVAHNFTVTARDIYGNTATGYTGTITFSSTDSQSVLPANYTFTSTDAGVHTFSAALKTVGSQSITATDNVTSSIKASQTGIRVNAAAASQLVVSGYPSVTTVSVPHSFTITALDAFRNVASGYTGTIAFSSSDGQAVLPANYAFTGLDAGVHTFSATMNTPGTQSITATDPVTITITGMETVTVKPAGVVATSIAVSDYPSPDTAGAAHSFTVTVTDTNGYTVIGYTGTVTFSTSDAKAALPTNFTFTSADYGVHVFSAILRTAGSQAITVTDTVNGSITGTEAGITVNPAATNHLVVSRFPSKTMAGVAQSFRVTAQDAFGNLTPNFADTVNFSSTDSQSVLPGSYTFTSLDAGIHNFSATLVTAGSQAITVQDATNATVASGTQSGIVVNPAAASHLQVAGFPVSVLAGSAHNFTVIALDVYGNIATGYRGTVTFNSSGQANLPANYLFISGDAGVHTFSVTLNTVGTNQWISATDVVNGGISSTEIGISVVPVQPTASVTGPALNFSGSAGIPTQLLTFTLGASESGLPDGTVYSYGVQWGDGSPVQTFSGPSGTQATHVYAAAGTYTVGVTATDPGGHASLLISTPVSVTTAALETDPVNPNLTALYVGGTTGNDNIAITPVAGGGVKVGMNYVNYGSFFPTGHVIVYSQGGNDIIKTAAQTISGVLTYVTVPVMFFAGDGNNVLNVSGSNVGNVLVGGGGSDRLIGGQGRDILIGGAGASTLQAGNPPLTNLAQGGAILIGGTTACDNNAAALAGFLAEWSSSDNYATRVASLSSSLNANTVHGNGMVNKLYGGAGMDWYFAGIADVLFNHTSDEVVTQI